MEQPTASTVGTTSTSRATMSQHQDTITSSQREQFSTTLQQQAQESSTTKETKSATTNQEQPAVGSKDSAKIKTEEDLAQLTLAASTIVPQVSLSTPEAVKISSPTLSEKAATKTDGPITENLVTAAGTLSELKTKGQVDIPTSNLAKTTPTEAESKAATAVDKTNLLKANHDSTLRTTTTVESLTALSASDSKVSSLKVTDPKQSQETVTSLMANEMVNEVQSSATLTAGSINTQQPVVTLTLSSTPQTVSNTADTLNLKAPQQLMQQLSDRLASSVSTTQQTLNFKLTPEGLGTLQIKLQVTTQQVHLAFQVDTPQAKQVLTDLIPKFEEIIQKQPLLSPNRMEQPSPITIQPPSSQLQLDTATTGQQAFHQHQQFSANSSRSLHYVGTATEAKASKVEPATTPATTSTISILV